MQSLVSAVKNIGGSSQPTMQDMVKQLKLAQQTQLAQFNRKCDEDLALLEALRDYIKRRSDLEADYGGKLEKFARNANPAITKRGIQLPGGLKNLIPGSTATAGDGVSSTSGNEPIGHPTSPAAGGSARLNQIAMATILGEAERQAKARMTMSELLTKDISDLIKSINKDKLDFAKKLNEYFNKTQQDLWKTYGDMDAMRIAYENAAKEFDVANQKYVDFQQDKKPAFMQTIKAMTKGGEDKESRNEKLFRKYKAAHRKLADARNEYLLALQNTNMFQHQYYTQDLPNFMSRMDGKYYASLTEFLSKYLAMEGDNARLLKEGVDIGRDSVGRIDRTRDLDIFIQGNAEAFRVPKDWQFDPLGADTARDLEIDDFTKVVLANKMGGWVGKSQELHERVQQLERAIGGLIQMTTVYHNNTNLSEARNPESEKLDLECQLDAARGEMIRVDAMIDRLKRFGVEPQRAASSYLENLPAPSRSTSLATVAVGAKALYAYTAQQPDELTIREGEELTLMGKEEGGWYQCRNTSGKVGMVPSNYLTIQTPTTPSTPSPRPTSSYGQNRVKAEYDHNTNDPTELSFRAGDVIEVTSTMPGDPDEVDPSKPELQWWEGRLNGKTGLFPVSFVSGWQPLVGTMNHSRSRGASPMEPSGYSPTAASGGSNQERYRAIYAYDAKVEGELSFQSGDVIRVTNKNTGSGAWWEGVRESDQRKGQFPVAYVEKLQGGSNWGKVAGSISRGPSVASAAQAASSTSRKTLKARYPYTAADSDELSFKEGDIVYVLTKDALDNEEWWEATHSNGSKGAVPKAYFTIE